MFHTSHRWPWHRIHFVGVGGVGVSALASLWHEQGGVATGCDHKDSYVLDHLRALGIKIQVGHHPSSLEGIDALVVSAAIASDHILIQSAEAQGIPIMQRAEFLGQLIKNRHVIAVSGTHGKTTTTALLVHLFQAAGREVGYMIGGRLFDQGYTIQAQWGKDAIFITEADESDRSLTYLHPQEIILNNIDDDHLDPNESLEDLLLLFKDWLEHLPDDGKAYLGIDCKVLMKLKEDLSMPSETYGLTPQATVRAHDWQFGDEGMSFEAYGQRWHTTLLGLHNVKNILAAIAVAHHHGLDAQAIQKGLLAFKGVSRRLELLGSVQVDGGDILCIDDYGHHPTAIATTIATLRKRWPSRRIVLCFQPHRYTRTKALYQRFLNALMLSDVTFVMPVYDCGEASIEGATSQDLVMDMSVCDHLAYLLDPGGMEAAFALHLKANDLLLCQGAGDVGSWVRRWVEEV